MKRAAPFFCVLLLIAPARAVFDVYLQVIPSGQPAIPGESVDPLYAGWIEVNSFEAGTDTAVTFSPTPDVAPTRFRGFTLSKKVDKATAPLFGKIAGGSPLASVKMVVALRSPTRVELWDIRATTCLVTEQGFEASAGGDLEERITFLMGAFEWSYVQINAAGDAMQEYFATWSMITNSGTSGTRPPSFPGGLDTDGDGIPDGWELFYRLNAQVPDATLDSDGDGLDNLREYIAHTDPRAPQSVLRVTALQAVGNDNYLLSWKSVTGISYRVQSAPAPDGPWSPVHTVQATTTGTTTVQVKSIKPEAFFRVITP